MLRINICENCGIEFKVFSKRMSGQKLCPTCRQEREITHSRQLNSVTVQREKIFTVPVKIVSLPGEWQEMPPIKSNSTSYQKMEVRGSALGANWEGQITIFSHKKNPPKAGDTAYFRLMISKKRVKKITWGNGQHTAVLPVWATEDDIPEMIASGKLKPEAANGELVDDVIQHDYIVLDQTHREPEAALLWGSGKLPEAGWEWEISGGGMTCTLALVGLPANVPAEETETDDWEQEYPDYDDMSDEELIGESALKKMREFN